MPTTVLRVERIKGGDGDGDIKSASASEKERYLVTFSDYNATGVDARNATSSNGSVPAYNVQLSTIGGAVNLYLTKKTATRSMVNPSQWVVECEYTTLSPVEVPPKPAGWTTGDKYGVQVSWRSIPFTEEIQKDVNGKPCTNCLGFPLDPPITRTKFDRQFDVTFYCDKADQTNIDACLESANLHPVTLTLGASQWIFATNTFYFADDSGETNFDPDGAVVFRETYSFIYRKDGWYQNRTNSSFYKAITPTAGIGTVTLSPGDVTPIMDGGRTLTGGGTITPQMIVQPRILDSTGAVIANGGSVTLVNGGLLQFQNIPLTDFASLLTDVP